MFFYCSSLTSLDLSNFNITNVNNIKQVLSSLKENSKIIIKKKIELNRYFY